MISAHASGKSQVALIGFISSNRAPRYEPQLKPGANYSLQNFFATTIDQIIEIAKLVNEEEVTKAETKDPPRLNLSCRYATQIDMPKYMKPHLLQLLNRPCSLQMFLSVSSKGCGLDANSASIVHPIDWTPGFLFHFPSSS
ncbi:hypothetical protein DY000_02033416 [Brassica cretica]|uniref:Uncharacterized protein n=1 Tax=Brassica cretica TaxID=69181 RepID=A0ABQ7DE27_BRACR|nr:hypothetical protein DY000_02033416 [Brassica cretica]